MGNFMADMFVWKMWNIFVGVRIDENDHFGNLARTTPQTLRIHPKNCHASEPIEDEEATAKFMRRFAEFSAGNSQTSGSIFKICLTCLLYESIISASNWQKHAHMRYRLFDLPPSCFLQYLQPV